jgi:hypothetical protein
VLESEQQAGLAAHRGTTMRSSKYLFPILGCALVACAAADETTGNQGSQQHIDPQGNDSPGSIVVVAPNGAANLVPTTFVVGGDESKAVSLGTTFSNVSVGTHGIYTRSDWLRTDQNVDVSLGKTTSVTAAGLGINGNVAHPTLGLGTTADTYGLRFENTNVPMNFADGSKQVALFGRAEPFKLTWGLLDGVSVNLAPGEAKLVAADDGSTRRITRLSRTKGDYPTACNGADTLEIGNYPYRSNGTWLRWDGQEVDVGISASNEGKHHYVYSDAWGAAFQIADADRGAGPLPWKVNVIDVDDVLVNQAQPRVKGAWAVFQADPKTGERLGSNILTCQPSTSTGVPLPPGHYRVEVYYQTVEAGQKTDVHIVDL